MDTQLTISMSGAVRLLRLEREMSVDQLGQAIGQSPMFIINQVENYCDEDECTLTDAQFILALGKILSVLGVSLEEFNDYATERLPYDATYDDLKNSAEAILAKAGR